MRDDILDKLSKEQHRLYRALDKDPDNNILKAEFLDIVDKIKTRQAEVLIILQDRICNKLSETKKIMRAEPKNFKKEIKRDYKVLMEQYRECMALGNRISIFKKEIRDKFL